MTKAHLRQTARDMRQQGLSVREIRDKLGVALSSVSVWVRDVEISQTQKQILADRQRHSGENNVGSQANQRTGMTERLAFQQEGREQARQGDLLHKIGCMLYWGEGVKDRNVIGFTNTDRKMLFTFMRFLRLSLQVPDEKIMLRVHCHTTDTQEHERIKIYWCDLFGLPLSCFNKMILLKSGQSKANVHQYGICTIRVYSTRLVQHIYGAIQEYGGFDNPDWLVPDLGRGKPKARAATLDMSSDIDEQASLVTKKSRSSRRDKQQRIMTFEEREWAQQGGREKAREQDHLHVMACMLYWAEGAKSRSHIALGGADPKMITLFTQFLKQTLRIADHAIHFYILCNTHDVLEHERMKNYWLSLLELPEASFRKTVLKKDSKFQHTSEAVGLCTVGVNDSAAVMHIYGAIQEYANFDKSDWLFD